MRGGNYMCNLRRGKPFPFLALEEKSDAKLAVSAVLLGILPSLYLDSGGHPYLLPCIICQT